MVTQRMVAGTTNDAGAEPNQFMFFYQSEKKRSGKKGIKAFGGTGMEVYVYD